jgi:Ca2+-binding RTX toxin-like protein
MTVLTPALAQEIVEQQGLDAVIPEIYTSISDYAFQNSQLASIDIPDSIKSIGIGAFDLNQITSVEIGSGVTSIGERAFSNNNLTSIDIPDSVASIGNSAFLGNQLSSVVIPNSIASIGEGVFAYNQLTSVVIPDSVILIGDFAFNVNKIESVVIPDSVTSIGMGAFYENQLTDVEIGDSVISVDSMAFKRNQLTHVVIPDSVTSLGTDVFKENPTLESISIFKDPLFDLSVFPKGVEIEERVTNDTPTSSPTEEVSVVPVQSVIDIPTRKKVYTFELKKPIAVGEQEVETIIVGTNKKDKITGSSEGEILAGGAGKNVLKGGGGSDGFLLDAKGFGKKHADKILDFNPDEGDRILVDKEVFGKRVKLKAVSSRRGLNKALRSKNNFVYEESKGRLYFNENGKEKGWGDGGLHAVLEGKPKNNKKSWVLAYASFATALSLTTGFFD